jgi:hypothetical protein
MKTGDTVYLLYASESFNSGTGFSVWVDEYKVVNTHVDDGHMLLKSSYGSLLARKPAEVYLTRADALVAARDILERRVDTVRKQIDKMQAEIAPPVTATA